MATRRLIPIILSSLILVIGMWALLATSLSISSLQLSSLHNQTASYVDPKEKPQIKEDKTLENVYRLRAEQPEKPFFFGKYPSNHMMTNGIQRAVNLTYKRTVVDHGKWKQIKLALPPWYWSVPNGLDPKTVEWFWYQPENERHFKDTNIEVPASIRIIENGVAPREYSNKESESHFFMTEGEPTYTDNPYYDTLMYLNNKNVEMFQHFLDNGIPQVALMLIASEIPPSEITIALHHWKFDSIPSVLRRWGFKDVIKAPEHLSAKRLIVPEVVPRVHALFHYTMQKGLAFNYSSNPDKIVLISRTNEDTEKNTRLISNQPELVKALSEKYGDRFVIFKPRSTSWEEAVKMFNDARIIISSHGGALYNAFWSSPYANIVEIIPVTPDGLYIGQYSRNGALPYCHLAFHTNSMLLGQNFWRYYMLGRSPDAEVPVKEFMKWLSNIPTAQ